MVLGKRGVTLVAQEDTKEVVELSTREGDQEEDSIIKAVDQPRDLDIKAVDQLDTKGVENTEDLIIKVVGPLEDPDTREADPSV